MKLLTLTQSKSFSAICAEVDQLIGNNYQRINVPSNSSAARQRGESSVSFPSCSIYGELARLVTFFNVG